MKANLNSKGFTLVEVLVSFVAMAIGMIAIWGLHMSSLRVDLDNRRQTEAIIQASQILEDLRVEAAENWDNVTPITTPQTIPGTPYSYTIVRTDNNTSSLANPVYTWRKDILLRFRWTEKIKDRNGNIIDKERWIDLTTYVTKTD